MRVLFIPVLFIPVIFLISLNVYSQNGRIIGHIANRDTVITNNYWNVFLKQGDSTIKATATDAFANFGFKDVREGTYKLTIQQIGFRDFTIDSLQMQRDTTIAVNLDFPPPCKFAYLSYLKDQKPKCIIGGHNNNIIPIVYGLPSKKTMTKAKKGLVHLGGCILSDCDPHYFCTIHNIEL